MVQQGVDDYEVAQVEVGVGVFDVESDEDYFELVHHEYLAEVPDQAEELEGRQEF